MTVKEHLQDKVNAWIAKQLWAKISTELDQRTMSGELVDERAQFPWLQKRMEELLNEFIPEKIRKARVKDEEKAED